jgi:hypothetical protein
VKVGIYETVEVSDEQRAEIAKVLGQKTASRDDLKAYIWRHGELWALDLGAASNEANAEADQMTIEDLL